MIFESSSSGRRGHSPAPLALVALCLASACGEPPAARGIAAPAPGTPLSDSRFQYRLTVGRPWLLEMRCQPTRDSLNLLASGALPPERAGFELARRPPAASGIEVRLGTNGIHERRFPAWILDGRPVSFPKESIGAEEVGRMPKTEVLKRLREHRDRIRERQSRGRRSGLARSPVERAEWTAYEARADVEVFIAEDAGPRYSELMVDLEALAPLKETLRIRLYRRAPGHFLATVPHGESCF